MYYLGETSYYSRDYAVAIPYYEKAIPLYEQARDTFNITNCFNSIGLCYHYMFQGEKAISQFIDGLKLNEHNKEYSAELISNIAMAHSRMNNNRDAIENYRKALLINISIKDSASIAVNYKWTWRCIYQYEPNLIQRLSISTKLFIFLPRQNEMIVRLLLWPIWQHPIQIIPTA